MKNLLLFLFFFHTTVAFAQQDTTYCKSYQDEITGRIYLSQKYTRLNLSNSIDKYDLGYRPNTTLNFGVGATYKWATLNLAYGFPFLNPENGEGKTKYLDLQAHFYGPKFTVDLFGQFYRGFYLYPRGTLAKQDQYYIRPDIRVNAMGGSVQYVFNNKRFSYRAAFLQNEWQRKSCGSLIAGAEIYWGGIHGDSSIVSSELVTLTERDKMRRLQYFEIGPSLGYAYTLVVHKNFFLSASLAFSFDYLVSTSYGNHAQLKSDGITPNNIFRVFAGYNSPARAFSVTFINSAVSLSTQKSASQVDLNTGNFRFNYVRRFRPGPKTKHFLRFI